MIKKLQFPRCKFLDRSDWKTHSSFPFSNVVSFFPQDNRMTASLRSMIGLFQKMFGDHFWENAILEATHWNYHSKNVALRAQSEPPIREEWWTDQFNELFRKVRQILNVHFVCFLSLNIVRRTIIIRNCCRNSPVTHAVSALNLFSRIFRFYILFSDGATGRLKGWNLAPNYGDKRGAEIGRYVPPFL